MVSKIKGDTMFTLDNKEYDETKLSDKGKIAFAQLQYVSQERSKLLLETDRLNTIEGANSAILKAELPKEEASAESKSEE
tara:strand:- start:3330 stop:3569 length:240 start_codon:yes stop_codon:yes gene_type:complete